MRAVVELCGAIVETVGDGEEILEERVKIVSRFDRGDRQPDDLKQIPESGPIHGAECVVRVHPCDHSRRTLCHRNAPRTPSTSTVDLASAFATLRRVDPFDSD